MTRIAPIDPDHAQPASTEGLAAVARKLGRVPNLLRTLAHAPAALEGYLGLSEALNAGRLTARQREEIALAVAQENGCLYCLSAHTALGRQAGLSAAGIDAARTAAPDTNPVAAFARDLVRARGRVSDAVFDRARAQGLDDVLMVEVVAQVALNVLTNYLNNLAGTAIDFPIVNLDAAA